MRRVRVVNRTRDALLAEQAELADNPWTRFVGLMGRRELPAGTGLVLKPGGGIHMWFMRIPLDVVHVDKRDRVTHVLRGIKPWRFGPLFVGNKLAFELPVGAADGTQVGDEIEIEPLEVTDSNIK
ncbi:MAG: DUF192 domain-containing protein [Chloroflexi bacterium]|nr:DUF192 domain-containing protein [Chloroflexota bacterium]MBV9595358.1 DUF192 domain-containing protein [Chloroflexota bacterium]